MKFLVNFINGYDRENNHKKSYYDLVICESHSPDISGMITLNKCFVFRNTHALGYYFADWKNEVTRNMDIQVGYREEEETIIVNREDISSINSIKDEDVDKFIPNKSQEEAYKESAEKVKESKEKSEKEMEEYNKDPVLSGCTDSEEANGEQFWFHRVCSWFGK